jgi:type VI secretion system ImpJ/VasE family protein
MSCYSKVIWSEGLFLRPQHFQQQDRYHEWWVEARTRGLGGSFWGWSRFELDEAALLTGKVVLNSACGVLPDGTPFDFPGAHAAPAALDFPADARNAIVYLALPLRRPNSLEAVRPDTTAPLARYGYADEPLLDSTGSGTALEEIEVSQPRLRLALAGHASEAQIRDAAQAWLMRQAKRVFAERLAHFAPLLARRERSVLAVLSAKVGSIGDNRLGGWYSYRASKAALNMLVKTASIEVARTHPQAVLVSLHPGTVDSALSAPFNGQEIGRAAADAAADMLHVLDGLQPGQTGSFHAYSGQPLPW